MFAKACLEELDFLRILNNRIWSIYNKFSNSDYQKLKRFLLELVIIHYVYESDSLLLEKYPKAFSFILSSKLIQLCDAENRFGEFLKNSIKKSIKYCSLILPYSYLPILDESKAKTLIYDYKQFNLIVNWSNSNLIFASTQNLYLIDSKTLKVVEKYDFAEFLKSEKFSFIRIFCVYLQEDVKNLDSKKIKDLGGGFLVRQQNRIYSFTFGRKLLFKKVFPTKIIEMQLVNTLSLLVQLTNSKVLQIVSVLDGKILCERVFSSNVKLIASNSSKQEVQTPSHQKFETYVCVLLETGEINLFRYEKSNDKLILVHVMPTSGNQPISIISDSFLHPENRINENINNENSACFACLFRNGHLCIINVKFDKTTENTNNTSVSLLHLKFDIDSSKKLLPLLQSKHAKFQDFFDSRILFNIGTNCFLYDYGNIYT